jgi:hypothetical protein
MYWTASTPAYKHAYSSACQSLIKDRYVQTAVPRQDASYATPSKAVAEPVFLIQALCTSAAIPNPFGAGEFQKADLSSIIIPIDLLVIFSLLTFASILNSAQLAYVAKFRDDTLEMTDFTIRVKNLPHDAKYGGENINLTAFLMAHFESVIKDQINKENK